MLDFKQVLASVPVALMSIQCAYAGMIPSIEVFNDGNSFVARGSVLTDDWENELYLKTHVKIASGAVFRSMNGIGKPTWLKGAELKMKRLGGRWVVEIIGGGTPPPDRTWDLLVDVGEKLLLFPVPPVRKGASVNVDASIEGVVSDTELSIMDHAYAALGKDQVAVAGPQVFAIKGGGLSGAPAAQKNASLISKSPTTRYRASVNSPEMKKLILLSGHVSVVPHQGSKKNKIEHDHITHPSPALLAYAEKVKAEKPEDEWGAVYIVNSSPKENAVVRLPGKQHQVISLGVKNLKSVIAKFHQKKHDTGDFVVVKKSETLLLIAAQMVGMKGTTVDQRMCALFKLNPYAFTNGNMNNLMAGVSLDMRIAQSDMLSRAESTEFVDRQYAVWQKKKLEGKKVRK